MCHGFDTICNLLVLPRWKRLDKRRRVHSVALLVLLMRCLFILSVELFRERFVDLTHQTIIFRASSAFYIAYTRHPLGFPKLMTSWHAAQEGWSGQCITVTAPLVGLRWQFMRFDGQREECPMCDIDSLNVTTQDRQDSCDHIIWTS